jgi:hypothetical protein
MADHADGRHDATHTAQQDGPAFKACIDNLGK